MYRRNIFLALLFLTNSSPVASFQRVGSRSLITSLRIRGGDGDLVDSLVDASIDQEGANPTDGAAPVEASGSATVEDVAPSTPTDPTSVPTYQKYMTKLRQPTSEVPAVESLVVDSEVEYTEEPTPVSNVGVLSALSFSTMLREIEYFYTSVIEAYPLLKFAFAIVLTVITVKLIAIFLADGEREEEEIVPPPTEITVTPIDKPDNAVQAALALVVGGVGLVAGSLAMASEQEEVRPIPAIVSPSESEDDETDMSCRQKAIGAGGAALAAGVGSRAMIIGKVLTMWF